MAEAMVFFGKDTFIIKPPKKSSPLLYRTIVLLFAVMCGLYICSICIRQIGNQSKTRFQNIQIVKEPCCTGNMEKFENPSMHYPRPQTFSRLECSHNPVRFFTIISMQRSGSGWFETLLNSHVNVSSNGEIFSVWNRRKNISSIIQTLDRVYNLDWFNSASKNECSAAVGFKWMLNQGLMEHHKEILEYLNRRGVSVVFLFRRNLLRHMVSVLANSYDRSAKQLNGTHKSHVHSPEEADTLSSYKPTINSTSLIDDLKEVEATVAKALAFYNTTRHIVLYYEDLIKDRTKLKDVQEFLNLPVMKLTSRQVKIHRGPVSDLISNWDKVNWALSGTVYESFIHDDY
ncbi:uncharacterized protein LOC115682577 [Syzygium oleosum]|uniref:uncharacterized protein LOC115682577 n=1 Tax=Syzygium oleosum TaxID=219896 RepID=UPI0011D25F91|nr:uncharacterized protein LOC115682577 [Syzygium oleosum]